MKTVVGSFDTFQDASRAADELRTAGIADSEINVVSNNVTAKGEVRRDATKDDGSKTATGAIAGGAIGGIAGAAVSLMGLAIPGIGPILAAGPIAAALAGAGAGAVAGGLIGSLTEMGVPSEHAETYAEAVRRGGALVIVRTEDFKVERVEEIIQGQGAFDIEERAEQWRESGWEGFNPKAKPYSYDEIERERDKYRDLGIR
jgi:uncharacterized membrane protein